MKFEFDYECDKEWDEMKGGDRRRFCDSCDKHVHHISGMTEEQAREFLQRHDYEVCVDFFRDAEGHTVFSEAQKKLASQSDGIKQLLASALAVVPLALGAAFIDFDKAEAPREVVVASERPPEPIELGGPRPVIVNTTANTDIEPHPVIDEEPPAPDIDETPVVPVIEDQPDPEPEPVVRPPRPHVRGKIAPPAEWRKESKKKIHLWLE